MGCFGWILLCFLFVARGIDAHISEDSPKDPHWTEWREEPVLCLLTSFPILSLLTPFPGRWLITSPLLNWFWRPRYANFHFSDMLERSHVTYVISSRSGWVEIRSWRMQLPSHCTHFVSSVGRPCFVAFCRYSIFLQVEGLLWQPCIKHSVSTIFPPAFAHFMPLCHILLILQICQTIYQEKHDESLKTQMMVSILSNKAFFNWASLMAQW